MQLTIMTELKVSAMRAATKMSELLNSENAMVQFRSSSYLLNTGAGIAPADNRGPLVNIGVASGSYVIDLRQDDEKAGPLTERDQAEVDAVRGGRSPGAVLLGRRGAPAGPVTIEGEAEVIDLPKRRADRDC
jgi:hypothetical protein